MKATLKSGAPNANVKPMSGGEAIAQMQPGDYVFGTESVTGSDIINFDHFYRANGVRFNLNVLCKVTALNMIKTNETEPNPDPDPDPDPDPTPDPEGVKRILYDDITYEANNGTIHTQRMIPSGPPTPTS